MWRAIADGDFPRGHSARETKKRLARSPAWGKYAKLTERNLHKFASKRASVSVSGCICLEHS
jgi:hypothetical protein